MSFVRYERTRTYNASPREKDNAPYLTLSKGLRTLHFNWVAIETIIRGLGFYVQLYFDEDTDSIGLDFQKEKTKSGSWLKITPSGKAAAGGSISCKDFIEKFNIDRNYRGLVGQRFPLLQGRITGLFYVQLRKRSKR